MVVVWQVWGLQYIGKVVRSGVEGGGVVWWGAAGRNVGCGGGSRGGGRRVRVGGGVG